MDDLISRKELLKRTIYNPLHVLYISSQDVLDCPSAQKKGHWIDASTTREQKWKCSECGEETTSSAMGLPRYRFCPMCGAYMRGGNDE